MSQFDFAADRNGRVEVVRYRDGTASFWVWNDDFSEDSDDASLLCVFSDRVEFFPQEGEWWSSSPPSDTLLSLIRNFHTHRAAAPLLDRLIEEYPQLEEWVNPAELLESVTASEGVA